MESIINTPPDVWTLPNGLRVVGEQLPYLRSVSVGVWVRTGSMLETAAENGLSHFLEHMVFKGTAKRNARQISQEMDAVGGQLNAFTSKECTCFYAKVVDEFLPLAIDILSDLTIHATLDAAELEKERGVILEEIAMDEDDPEDLAFELMATAQFGKQSAARPILGPAEQVSRYTRDDLFSFRATHYRPQDTVLSLCGHYDKGEVTELIARYFGGWHSSAEQLGFPVIETHDRQNCVRVKDTEQLHLCMGYPAPCYSAAESGAFAMFSSILGGAMSSRLFQRIREELGLAYSVYSTSTRYINCGSYAIYAGVSPKNGMKVLQEIRSEIDRMLKDGITDKEFTDTRQQLLCSFLLGLESPGSRMQANGRRLLLTNSLVRPEEVEDMLRKTTMDDVLAMMHTVLDHAPCLTAVGRTAESYAEVHP